MLFVTVAGPPLCANRYQNNMPDRAAKRILANLEMDGALVVTVADMLMAARAKFMVEKAGGQGSSTFD